MSLDESFFSEMTNQLNRKHIEISTEYKNISDEKEKEQISPEQTDQEDIDQDNR